MAAKLRRQFTPPDFYGFTQPTTGELVQPSETPRAHRLHPPAEAEDRYYLLLTAQAESVCT